MVDLIGRLRNRAEQTSDYPKETLYSEAADELTALREALSAMCAAQHVEPYRGWNLTALNQATDKARALLGLPSVRELNPDIAAMQDHAAANKGAIAHG